MKQRKTNVRSDMKVDMRIVVELVGWWWLKERVFTT
jgi:hypothetical protein